VTANIFFPKVCEIKFKINSWKEDENEIIRNMSSAMIEKYDKYWCDIQGLMVVAVILDPHLKMIMLQACYMALLGQEEADRYCQKSYELLTQLMDEYQVQIDQEVVGTSSYGASNSLLVLMLFCPYSKHLLPLRRPQVLLKQRVS